MLHALSNSASALPSQSSTSRALEPSVADAAPSCASRHAARHRVRERLEDRFHVVLRLQAVLHDLELQRAHRRQDRLDPGLPERIEHLNRSLLAQLRDPFLERFVARGVGTADQREMFRLERRDRFEPHALAVGQRVADREDPGVRQTHHVAGEGDVDRFAVGREQLHRARQPHVFAGAHVAHGHVALELAAAHAHERDAVAVARVHVGLDLEHEPAEALVGRLDAVLLARRRAAPAAGPCCTNASRNSSTPKFVIALPKNTGVTSPRSIASWSKSAPAPSSSSSCR